MNFIELADIAWKLRKKDFYASAIKHLGIGLSVGWLVSTQISKKLGNIGWATVQTTKRGQRPGHT